MRWKKAKITLSQKRSRNINAENAAAKPKIT